MPQLPYVIISTAMSLDGYIDTSSNERLILSNEKDLEQVEELRKSCDGILVGANTIRKDNPQLVSKSETPLTKITITVSGDIDTFSNFFTAGDSQKMVYTVFEKQEKLSKKLLGKAIVIGAGHKKVDLLVVLEDLFKRGIKRLLVEGGSTVLTQFLREGLVNEIRLAIAGFFVGQRGAPKFVKPGKFVWDKDNRMHLEKVEKLDDIAVLIYKL